MKTYGFLVPIEKGGGTISVMAEDEEKARKRIAEYYDVSDVSFLKLMSVF